MVNVSPKGIPTQARWHQEIKFLLVSFDSSIFKRVADETIVGSDVYDGLRLRTIEIIPQRGVCDRQILHLGMAQLKAEYSQKTEAEATEQGAWYENLTFFVTGKKL
ncbi:MAG: hypothetical protein RM049_17685 [Nostoc sp. DedQUE04]|uniref:hypothetical protein n=1 Tax=Nostoc sp. DedQUE04 TaxID=3075390 RepID=UPI002AD1FAA7|nr:hypothetical protein [Nostoc sp. DedQUE04]MDZ8137108.1 hypothetical protein [Nostoc sp. DedQUE04]